MSDWLQTLGNSETPLARLFCFPHAGGAANSFRPWRERMPREVELMAVQLPGRGYRLREPPIASVPALTGLLAAELLPYLDRPYAFFGHSMGAVLALEVARAITGMGHAAPAHLFLSARRPPHLPRLETDLHPLPDAEFLEALGARYGGIPAQVLQEPELLALFLPALRADFTALETFVGSHVEPLACAITAFGGEEDQLVTQEQLHEWRRYTRGPFRQRQFRGGHFYLHTAEADLLADVNLSLASIIAHAAPGNA